MLITSKHSAISRSRHPLIYAGVALLFCAVAFAPAFAVDVPTLYTAEVFLDENADDPRNEAYRAALIEVLARVSGSELSSDPDHIDELFPVPILTLADLLSKLQFGADAVGARNKHRFAVLSGRQRKHSAKPAQSGKNFRSLGTPH